jgi:predicted phage terminase large subunit-like protein
MNGQLELDNPRSVKIWKARLEADFLAFTRFFFKKRLGYKMKVAPHHKVICETLVRVYTGEIKRLIINIAPGYTKTELAVISFIAWTHAKNPKSKFIHVTYSNDLALENSTMIREVETCDEYHGIWFTRLRLDSKAKGTWKNTNGGGMQARAAGGPITGFRAGQPESGFSGAFIIDDPLKPDDAHSEKATKTVNKRFNGVFRSRLMVERETPMIVIMQRLAVNDPSGFLLKGGTNEKWYHLCLPALVDNSVEYPAEYTHGIEIKHGLPNGPLWPYKHTEKELESLRLADPYVYDAQYKQAPQVIGGGIFKKGWWKSYIFGSIRFEWMAIFADTAQKTKEDNDYSVFQCWGFFNGDIYLVDQIRDRWEAPDLIKAARQFWDRHYGTGEARTTGKLRYMAVEDKSSGTGLIQTLTAGDDNDGTTKIPVRAIQRNIDKKTRAMDTVPLIASGRVFIPDDKGFVLDFLAEVGAFSGDMTHDYDDQVDPMMDAVQEMLGTARKKAGAW